MIPARKLAAILVAAFAGAAAAVCYSRAQPQEQTPNVAQAQATTAGSTADLAMDRNVVVLDPAHGGPDAGATLGDTILEKDVTLALASRLRAALTAAGITVVSTRDANSVDMPANDQRAAIANRAHALACLVIHATASGSGVHLYTSELQPVDAGASPDNPPPVPAMFVPVRWDTAQAGFVSQSLRLASSLSAALGTANIPVVAGQVPVTPLDNLMCPAVAIELAPLRAADGDTTPVTDANYQQRVAAALATALGALRGNVDASSSHPSATASSGTGAVDAAAQNKAAEAAAAAARAAAEASGRAAAGIHAAPAGLPGGQGQTNKVKSNGASKAEPASSSTGAGAHAAQTGGSK